MSNVLQGSENVFVISSILRTKSTCLHDDWRSANWVLNSLRRWIFIVLLLVSFLLRSASLGRTFPFSVEFYKKKLCSVAAASPPQDHCETKSKAPFWNEILQLLYLFQFEVTDLSRCIFTDVSPVTACKHRWSYLILVLCSL